MEKWTVDKMLAAERGEFERIRLADDFYERLGISNEALKVPLPVRKEDLQTLKKGEELPADRIVDNLVFACSDPSFDSIYSAYIYSLTRMFGNNLSKILIGAGDAYAGQGHYMRAAIVFRAMERILLYLKDHSEQGPDVSGEEFDNFQKDIEEHILIAKFRFAMALHVEYNRIAESLRQEGDGEQEKLEKIRVLKAEVLELLELVTKEDPEFYPAYYPLAYAYWNLGQYTKASICFKRYTDLIDNLSNKPDQSGEVNREGLEKQYRFAQENIEELKDLVTVEQAINDVLRGAFLAGLETLKDFVDDKRFKAWWPIHFYIAFAQENLGLTDAAIFSYLKVLRLNGSHIGSMEGLMRSYDRIGDEEKVEKYRKKISLVKENQGIYEN